MRVTRRLGWLGVALVLLLVGCGRSNNPAPITGVVATATEMSSAVAAAGTSACWTPDQVGGQLTGTSKPQWTQPPAMVIDPTKAYTATVQTNKGTFVIQLLATEAPQSVNNFVCLVRAGFFDGTPFHRIVAGFVIQGGDPTGTGTGGPGYAYNGERPSTPAYRAGTVAMANSNGPSTNGSQFFVCLADLQQRLPANYTIFGTVSSGMDIVNAIGATPTKANSQGEQSVPLEPVTIQQVTISEG